MAQVSVTIAGKLYRMACGDGEEAHLEGLAADLDTRIGAFRTAFGEIGEMRLQVMAALALADELSETRSRVAALEAQAQELAGDADSRDARIAHAETRMTETLTLAAERLERLARATASRPEGAAPEGG